MRADRGYFCLPEVEHRPAVHGGMNGVITARLDHVAAREAMLTGRRYTAEEALDRRIVDAIVPEEQVVPDAIERAAPHVNKPRAPWPRSSSGCTPTCSPRLSPLGPDRTALSVQGSKRLLGEPESGFLGA